MSPAYFVVSQNSSENGLFLLQHMLSKVGTWNFDIFLFDRLTNGETAVNDLFYSHCHRTVITQIVCCKITQIKKKKLFLELLFVL